MSEPVTVERDGWFRGQLPVRLASLKLRRSGQNESKMFGGSKGEEKSYPWEKSFPAYSIKSMDTTYSNFLGLDWGAAKVGVALAHAEIRTALAYSVIKNDASLVEHIGSLIEKEEIGMIVIGVHKSATFAGEHEGEKLGKLLQEKFAVEVVYQDEMFTSKMAQQNLIAQGAKNVSAHDDAEAASILLQSWLDRAARER